ncbi:MAG: hypothetical protein VB997_07075, partial [Opitutales bacterium]
MMDLTRTLGLFGLTLGFAGALPADVVVITNGSRLVGKVLGVDDGNLTLATEYAGHLRISLPKIAGVQTDENTFLRLDDNR